MLSEKLNQDYTFLSKLLFTVEGITIEKYIFKQKIEKVIELIIYDELNLSEIAYQLNYRSVAHLSSQYNNETGMTPSAFKKLDIKMRKTFDNKPIQSVLKEVVKNRQLLRESEQEFVQSLLKIIPNPPENT